MNRSFLHLYSVIYAIFMSQKTEFFIIDLLIPVVIFLCCAREHFFSIAKNLATLNVFILLIVIFVAIEGEEDLAFTIFIRSNLVLFLMLSVFSKSEFFEIARVAATFKFPKKFVLLLYFSLKSIHSIKKESFVVLETLKSRGFEGRFGLFTYQTYAFALAQLMRKSYLKTLHLNETLESRGFGSEIFFFPYRGGFSLKDVALLGLFILFTLANLYVLLYHH